MIRRLSALAAAVVLAVAGCTADEPAPSAPQPFRPCPPATADPASPGADVLPAIALACFAGGDAVRLDRLRGPLVINLWASWCAPCRKELPELQRFADLAGDRVTVLGVVTGDTPAAAASLGDDLSVSLPMLRDDSEELRRALGRGALPVTVLVDAQGIVRYVTSATASAVLTLEALTELVRKHLDLEVS